MERTAGASARARLPRPDASGGAGGVAVADAGSAPAAWRVCAEGGACVYRPPRRAAAGSAVASAERPAAGRARKAGAAQGVPHGVALSAASALSVSLLAAPAHAAERLQPPLSSSGGGGGGGGGGGASGAAQAGAKRSGRKRVMILMSDTGGGHRASAEALKAAFHIEFGDDYDVSVVDLWSHHSPYPTNKLPKSYNFLVKYPWLWRLNFMASSPAPVHNSMFLAYSAVVARSFAAAFDKYDPDLIISVHPLMQHVPLRVLARRAKASGRKAPPFATVVTDLTSCHPTWFHRGVDRCFVPTEEVAALARRVGLTNAQIVQHGLPIRPAFAAPLPPRPALRQKLGLAPQGSVVLLMGGGEGMGLLEPTALALAEALPPSAQIVVVCGRNAALASRLAARQWPCRLVAKGFVSNIDEWMGASDVVITKAGPGTIAEALIRGVPLLLNGAIPCQEEGNVPFVVENGVGQFNTEPKAIAAQVASWFGPAADELAAMAAKAKTLGRPNATFRIVRDLADLCTVHTGAVKA